jgi:hypothetical protein
MTTKEAIHILREAGEIGFATPSRPALKLILAHAFDPVIKKACDKLLLMLIN